MSSWNIQPYAWLLYDPQFKVLKLVSRPSMSLSVVNPKLIGTWFLPHGAKARIDED